MAGDRPEPYEVRMRLAIEYLRKTRMEEANLVNAFGDRYGAYRKETWAMNIKACMKQADYVFENNGDVEDLYKKVGEVLEKIGK